MLVYRVEGANGTGPYTSDWFSLRYELGAAHRDDRHPSPYACDILTGIEWNEFCGFDSVDSLLTWFEKKWRRLFQAEGFNVRVFESDKARVGEHGQTLFVKDEAEYVTEYTMAELEAEHKELTK